MTMQLNLQIDTGIRVLKGNRTITCGTSTLLLTPYHLTITDASQNQVLEIATSTIKSVDKKFQTVDTREIPIYLQTSTFVFVKLFIRHEVDAETLYSALVKIVNIETVDELYAFHYCPDVDQGEARREIYDVELEFARQGLTSLWRVSRINEDYAFCASCLCFGVLISLDPKLFIVPEKISDTVLKHIGGFRSKSRIPVLSYIHSSNGSSITRSSQPMVCRILIIKGWTKAK
jgi:hypothetical protein